MHGQKIHQVQVKQNYNYVQVCPKRKDGTSALVQGDIWVDSDAMPIQQYNWNGSEWLELDNADPSSTNGVVFGHFSADVPGTQTAQKMHVQYTIKHPTQNYTQQTFNPMINMDYSTYNVKRYTDGKWEWCSGLNPDGSGKFGADAQRHMVVEAMQAALAGNEGLRRVNILQSNGSILLPRANG